MSREDIQLQFGIVGAQEVDALARKSVPWGQKQETMWDEAPRHSPTPLRTCLFLLESWLASQGSLSVSEDPWLYRL